MTDERRQDFLLMALVFSVVAHVALMIVMKPHIMAYARGGAARATPREPMHVREVPLEATLVEMDAVQDFEALREAPVSADVLTPANPTFNEWAANAEKNAPALEMLQPDDKKDPSYEVAAYLSEKLSVEDQASTFSTPIVKETFRAPAREATMTIHEPAVDVSADDVPLFTAPVVMPTFQENDVEEMTRGEASEKISLPFVPADEVLATVDEKIVEDEKTAVRELLNVKNVQPLEKFVSCATTSARAGEWIYFRVQMNPRATLPVIPKDFVVLLDASGSIGNDRLKSCRLATQRIFRSCVNTGDRFNLVAFRDRFSYAFRSWQDCSQESFDRADEWLTSLAAYGRTDVFSVIRSVLTLPRSPERPLIALVVTDGDANAGVSETAQILSRFTTLNDGLISVYMYGVKESANQELIDVLTHGNRGEGYIYNGFRRRAGSQIEGLGENFRDPVLSDLRVLFTSDSRAEFYPKRLRNFYRGGVVDFVGRVPKDQKTIAFSVRGLNGAKSYEGFFKIDLAMASFDPDLPARWKTEFEIDKKLR